MSNIKLIKTKVIKNTIAKIYRDCNETKLVKIKVIQTVVKNKTDLDQFDQYNCDYDQMYQTN